MRRLLWAFCFKTASHLAKLAWELEKRGPRCPKCDAGSLWEDPCPVCMLEEGPHLNLLDEEWDAGYQAGVLDAYKQRVN